MGIEPGLIDERVKVPGETTGSIDIFQARPKKLRDAKLRIPDHRPGIDR